MEPSKERTWGSGSVRFAFWLAWSLAVALALVQVLFSAINRNTDVAGEPGPVLSIFLQLVLIAFVTLGVLVSYRRPGNPVGWIITGTGMSLVLSGFAQSYGVFALYTDPGHLPGARL